MSTPPIELRTSFWKHAYARASFIDAKSSAEMILHGAFEGHGGMLKALSIATLVTYGRPFKQKSKVKLSEDFVAASHKSTHTDLIVWRDKVIAHRDLDGPVADWGFVSQLLIEIDDQGFSPQTLSPVLSIEKARDTVALADDLIRAMDAEMNQFVQTYGPQFSRTSGLYTMNLEDDASDWLLPTMPSSEP